MNIVIKGARENNLKNINLNIPKNNLIVFTGLSGGGKQGGKIVAQGTPKEIIKNSKYLTFK